MTISLGPIDYILLLVYFAVVLGTGTVYTLNGKLSSVMPAFVTGQKVAVAAHPESNGSLTARLVDVRTI